jgi:hypothetical protein
MLITSTPVASRPQQRLIIVGCGRTKAPTPTLAGALYTGSYHAACRRAAAALARQDDTVMILSAKHGLLDLDEHVAPYELTLGQPGAVTADQVRQQATERGLLMAPVTVLAGRAYARLVTEVWPGAAQPLAGTRGIGEQLHRLARMAGR